MAEDGSEFKVDGTSVGPARGLVVQGQHQADDTQSVHTGVGWGAQLLCPGVSASCLSGEKEASETGVFFQFTVSLANEGR